MEIHAPDKPILTLKEAAIHLIIVTAGILIALSLEGAVEWRHHRALVREARANLAAEIVDNKSRTERLIGELPRMRKRLQDGLAALTAFSRHQATADAIARLFQLEDGGMIYGYDLAELRAASRTTAEVTGAFGLMDYDEVIKYAAVYDRQSLFNQTQDAAWRSGLSAFSLGQSMDFAVAAPDAIENIRREIRVTLGNLIIEEQVAAALVKAYDRALLDAR